MIIRWVEYDPASGRILQVVEGSALALTLPESTAERGVLQLPDDSDERVSNLTHRVDPATRELVGTE